MVFLHLHLHTYNDKRLTTSNKLQRTRSNIQSIPYLTTCFFSLTSANAFSSNTFQTRSLRVHLLGFSGQTNAKAVEPAVVVPWSHAA